MGRRLGRSGGIPKFSSCFTRNKGTGYQTGYVRAVRGVYYHKKYIGLKDHTL